MKICEYCGLENKEEALQCEVCGTTEFQGPAICVPLKPAQLRRGPVMITGLLLLSVGMALLGLAVASLVLGQGRIGANILGLLFVKVLVLSNLIKSRKVRLSWPRFLTRLNEKSHDS